MNQKFSRRTVIGGLSGAMLTSACQRSGGGTDDAASHPNVIFIMADDLGYADLSCTGSRHIQTPNIDRIAKKGLFFTNGYANSAICSPTRTALLAGRYQYRYPVGLEEPLVSSRATQNDLGFPLEDANIASAFKAEGYETALIGKWHLGLPPKYNPLNFGYDYYFGITGGAADYFRHGSVRGGEDRGLGLFENSSEIERNGYLTDLFGNKAVEIVSRAKDKPLFLSLHFTAPHWPWEGREDEDVSRTLNDFFHYDGGSLEVYARMVKAMDENIGKLVQALEDTGQLENSIIVFTSDNGGERFSDNWPFTGVKGELLEGGIRVPLLIQWPQKIAAGRRTDQVMTSMDFLPTLLGMTGRDTQSLKLDGADLSPQILNEAPELPRTLFWRFKANEQAAVRDGDWKYLKLGGKEHLFNVVKDPRERAMLNDLHPEKLAELKQKYAEWDAQMLPYPAESRTEDVRSAYPDRY